MPPLKPAIFLDRDNTLTRDRGYTYRIEDFVWMEGAPLALKRFHDAGLPVFVVTNQGGVGLGFMTAQDVYCFNRYLRAEAERCGGFITDIACCFHHPKATDPEFQSPCPCRKPAPGLILDLARKWNIDLPCSVMIGDRDSDVEAGLRAGCNAYRFEGGNLDLLAQEILKRHFGVGL